MDSLALTTSTFCTTRSLSASSPSSSSSSRIKVSFHRTTSRRSRRSFAVFASKDDLPILNQWEQMELKFGRMIGEDPNLTLAKIMGKRLNPDATAMDIENAFYKNKGKFEMIEEVPFDVLRRGKSSSVDNVELQVPVDVSREEKSMSGGLSGLNLVRPVPKVGVKFTSQVKKPFMKAIKKKNRSGGDASVVERPPLSRTVIPNVMLRKPEYFKEDDSEEAMLSRLNLSIKPNLSLNTGNEFNKEHFTDMTLIRKPAPVSAVLISDSILEDVKVESTGDVTTPVSELQQGQQNVSDVTMLKKPEPVSKSSDSNEENSVISHDESGNIDDDSRVSESFNDSGKEDLTSMNTFENRAEDGEDLFLGDSTLKDNPVLKPPTNSDLGSGNEEAVVGETSDSDDDSVGISMEGALLGRPKRVDRPVKELSSPGKVAKGISMPGPVNDGDAELEKFISTSLLKEREEIDWERATDLIRLGARADVELISSSTRGFVVSFGSLIGFLPYRNLAAKWKFLAFESWLRKKGLDPSKYRQSLGVIGGSDGVNKNASFGSIQQSIIDPTNGTEISEGTSMEDLLQIYDQEKLKFLSSFVGQRIKVNVLAADKGSRKLVFSIKPRENEELTVKKRNLMAKLSVGDIVKCCIKKVTYFGIFVEVEGVLALVHQTEVSWDTTLDPTSMYKIGQVVEAKVHQLDFALERIFLSLKEIRPDPLIDTLESVVGEAGSLDEMWADVNSLIRELQQIEGIEIVSKGRYFLSPGLAPTFQVYMASMYEKQYKLLARAGNKVQEVIVEASLDKEEMKSAILTCTNRVER